MECSKEMVSLMHSYLDGDLQPEEELRLKEHLRSCAACAAHFHELKKTIAFLQYASHVTAPPSFMASVMESMPKERKTARLRRWLHGHPLLTAASLFLFLTVGSVASSWGEKGAFSVSADEHVMIRDHTVIVPKGETVKGDIVVRNGSIRIEGTVDGDVTVIHGEKYMASAGRVTGEVKEINQVFEWIWYNIKERASRALQSFE
ncbi:anti-sigma factor [Geobacillus subterraneus]|uniref:Anti-sigma-W factor RsiW n=2 Tax=Geobacillus TaxID=129337 RepID=A0ABM6AEL3_9BACL|nr:MULTISPECIES: anti-sigma-W factor RsiW [Geobacillus]AMX84802.1 anti-sigma factor [Geobacillus subterraneus]KZS25414.1 anti-sigma factor [Geobacillus subterraneus]OXB85629.1 anti-sigma factor [Geobacillus uzenensis]QIZ66369.1 anti-sigma-W factor RsiW [Geobacillus subterraneus]WPZ18574.1 anti-sigma-W factor RsiW [Geobacillus subterraneus]